MLEQAGYMVTVEGDGKQVTESTRIPAREGGREGGREGELQVFKRSKEGSSRVRILATAE